MNDVPPGDDWEPSAEEESDRHEPFVAVPSIFWAHLSPEQFRAQQQIYQTAYEKARKQQADRSGGEESFFQI